MIFYQITTSQVSSEQLIDALLLQRTPTNIISLRFTSSSPVTTIQDALDIVEKKRKTLSRSLQHSFLCLEIVYDPSCETDTIVQLTHNVADTLNAHFNNDAFILSMVYVDDAEILHPTIILSNIEKSLPEPSEYRPGYEELHQIVTDALPNFHIPDIYLHALFQFNGEQQPLAYDGVIHLKCDAIHCPEADSNTPTE